MELASHARSSVQWAVRPRSTTTRGPVYLRQAAQAQCAVRAPEQHERRRRRNARAGRMLCKSLARSGVPDCEREGDRPPPCRERRSSRVRCAMDRSTWRGCGEIAVATVISEPCSVAGSAAVACTALGSAAETGTDADTALAGRMRVPKAIPPGDIARSALLTVRRF